MRNQIAAAIGGNVSVLTSHPYLPGTPFWQTAADDGVHLLVIDRARETGAWSRWPRSAVTEARQAVVDAAAVQNLRERELAGVLNRLADARVSPLLLKGVAVAYTHYRRPYLRPRRDTDLLVRREDLDRMATTLESAGYARAVETSGELATSQYHFERVEPPSGLHALDVHWRISNPRVFADSITYDELAGRCTPIPDLGPHAWTLAPGHALVLACIHRVAHHADSENLLWLWDVHLLVSTLAEEEARAFEELASRSATRAICVRGLMLAAEHFGAPGACELVERVGPVPESEPEASARFLDGGLRLVDVLRADLNATQAWRARATLVREHLFPPVSYIRATYAGWPMAFLPLAYAHRIITGAPRWLRRPRRH